jgi:hypothetical protein
MIFLPQRGPALQRRHGQPLRGRANLFGILQGFFDGFLGRANGSRPQVVGRFLLRLCRDSR